jgi:hypothetical protein
MRVIAQLSMKRADVGRNARVSASLRMLTSL